MINIYLSFFAVVYILIVGICIYNDRQHVNNVLDHNSIYKIIPIDNLQKWNTENCIVQLQTDINSGFIHMAFGHQVTNVLNKFFYQHEKIFVLEINTNILKKMNSILLIENGYPHIYGNTNIPIYAIDKQYMCQHTGDDWFIV